MSRGDPHRMLLRALGTAYPGLVVERSSREPWASVTFSGERHVLHCAGEPDLAGLEGVDLPMCGHFVADVAVIRGEGGVRIEALTIEAA